MALPHGQLDMPGYLGPFVQYGEAWKSLRSWSNEEDLIVEGVRIAAERYSQEVSLWRSIADIGAADGSLFKKILSEVTVLNHNVDDIILVEPRRVVLEAAQELGRSFPRAKMEVLQKRYEDVGPEFISDCGCVLMSHVIYYLDERCLRDADLLHPNQGIKIIVTNTPESLFVRCWRVTAPYAASRVDELYRLLRGQPNVERIRRRMTIDLSGIDAAFLLSLLALREAEDLEPEVRTRIEDMIEVGQMDGGLSNDIELFVIPPKWRRSK